MLVWLCCSTILRDMAVWHACLVELGNCVAECGCLLCLFICVLGNSVAAYGCVAYLFC